eukprot:scaffold3428_cov379-Prasinococcus_capsulatus_cf.AAC.6
MPSTGCKPAPASKRIVAPVGHLRCVLGLRRCMGAVAARHLPRGSLRSHSRPFLFGVRTATRLSLVRIGSAWPGPEPPPPRGPSPREAWRPSSCRAHVVRCFGLSSPAARPRPGLLTWPSRLRRSLRPVSQRRIAATTSSPGPTARWAKEERRPTRSEFAMGASPCAVRAHVVAEGPRDRQRASTAAPVGVRQAAVGIHVFERRTTREPLLSARTSRSASGPPPAQTARGAASCASQASTRSHCLSAGLPSAGRRRSAARDGSCQPGGRPLTSRARARARARAASERATAREDARVCSRVRVCGRLTRGALPRFRAASARARKGPHRTLRRPRASLRRPAGGGAGVGVSLHAVRIAGRRPGKRARGEMVPSSAPEVVNFKARKTSLMRWLDSTPPGRCSRTTRLHRLHGIYRALPGLTRPRARAARPLCEWGFLCGDQAVLVRTPGRGTPAGPHGGERISTRAIGHPPPPPKNHTLVGARAGAPEDCAIRARPGWQRHLHPPRRCRSSSLRVARMGPCCWIWAAAAAAAAAAEEEAPQPPLAGRRGGGRVRRVRRRGGTRERAGRRRARARARARARGGWQRRLQVAAIGPDAAATRSLGRLLRLACCGSRRDREGGSLTVSLSPSDAPGPTTGSDCPAGARVTPARYAALCNSWAPVQPGRQRAGVSQAVVIALRPRRPAHVYIYTYILVRRQPVSCTDVHTGGADASQVLLSTMSTKIVESKTDPEEPPVEVPSAEVPAEEEPAAEQEAPMEDAPAPAPEEQEMGETEKLPIPGLPLMSDEAEHDLLSTACLALSD